MSTILLRIFFTFTISFVCLITLPGSSYIVDVKATPKPAIIEPIRITLHNPLDYAPIILAQEQGLFDNASTPIHFILNDQYSESESTYLNGEADGIFEDFSDTVLRDSLSNSSNIQSKVVYVKDYSTSKDTVISKLYNNLTSLKGTKIGFDPTTTSSKLFLTEILRKSGLEPNEYALVPASQKELISSLENGSLSAGHNSEKDLPQGFQVIATAEDLPGIITHVLAFRSSIIKDHSKDIQAIIDAFSKGIDLLESNRTDSLLVLQKSIPIDPAQLEYSLGSISLLNLTQNKLAMTKDSTKTFSLPSLANITGAFYLQSGIIQNMPSPERMYDSTFADQ
jgi:NitT/TauT family transport system substrate-binding protein